jgi:hypothetical protein
MLELKNVRKSFGDVRVLNGVNVCLEKGVLFNDYKRTMSYNHENVYYGNYDKNYLYSIRCLQD